MGESSDAARGDLIVPYLCGRRWTGGGDVDSRIQSTADWDGKKERPLKSTGLSTATN